MKEAVQSALFVASLSAVTYGCYLAWPPLGWIVPGALVLAGTCLTFAVDSKKE